MPMLATPPEREAPAAEREALAGLVERVTFHDPENGFCVLRVKARGQRDLVTVVGHAAMITAGEFVQISGTHARTAVPRGSPQGHLADDGGRARTASRLGNDAG